MSKAEVEAVEEMVALARQDAETELARVKSEQADRERRIAECHEAIGRVQAAQALSKFGNVAGLVWLKDARDTKVYKDLPGVGTWDKFCERLGMSRRKAEEDLENLATFGEQFMATVAGLRVGYRELKKLRRSAADGQLLIADNAVTIGGELIPLDAEHREDLQIALEAVIETNAKLLVDKNQELAAKDRVLADKEELLQKQEREILELETKLADRTADLDAVEEAYVAELFRRKTQVDAALLALDPEKGGLPEGATVRMRAEYLATLSYLCRVVERAYDQAVTLHGAPEGEASDEGWAPPSAHEQPPPRGRKG